MTSTTTLPLPTLADAIYRRVIERRSVGIDSGLLVFGLDGTGGAWYSTGSRPSLTEAEMAIVYDRRTTLATIRYDLGIPAEGIPAEDDR